MSQEKAPAPLRSQLLAISVSNCWVTAADAV
jgi:hypothetical protein